MRRSSKASTRSSAHGRRGFTLLEVLGAVLVLGMLYSVLAEVAIQGLRAEGEGRRRLEASLYADELLSEIEISLADGALPPLGISVEEDEPYLIELEVRPLVMQALLPLGAPGEATPSSLAGTDPEENPIREIALKISWSEGDRELHVTRTTLAVAAEGFGSPAGGTAEGLGAPAPGTAEGFGSPAGGTAGSAAQQPSRRNAKRSDTISDILRRRAETPRWLGKRS